MIQDKNDKEGTDFSGALRDDSGTGAKFQEYQVERSFYPGTPKVIRWVIKYSGGLVKDEKQAGYIIWGFVAVAIIISLFLFFGEGSGQPTSGTIPADQFVP